MKAQLTANVKTLLAMDEYATVDVALIDHIVGPGGRCALQRHWESQCGPQREPKRVWPMQPEQEMPWLQHHCIRSWEKRLSKRSRWRVT